MAAASEKAEQFYYDTTDMIGRGCGEGVVGFTPVKRQPYPSHRGLRLGVPGGGAGESPGFTEVVQITTDLHAVITNWPEGSGGVPGGVWAEHSATRYGWLYVGIEGDGRLQVEGLGAARRAGVCCSITVTPRESTYIWRHGLGKKRRGICIAFHARYLLEHYPSLSRDCFDSLGAWLAGKERALRDFDLPCPPVMSTAAAALLDSSHGGVFRYEFVCSTVEQLLSLALSALVRKEEEQNRPVKLSTRDKDALHRIRDSLLSPSTRPTSIDKLALRFGINRNKMRFGFKILFGQTPAEFSHQERMTQAYELLSQGTHSVTEVAITSGYRHASNFTTAFKRKFGSLPSELCDSARTPSHQPPQGR